VLQYLDRYTHRVAISNHHLTSRKVTFLARFRYDNEHKLMTLSLEEFLRRFLLRVLPKGFVRVRHSASGPPIGVPPPCHFACTCTCTAFIRWERPVSAGCDTFPMFDVLKAHRKGDRQCGRLPLFGQRELEFSKCVSSRLDWTWEIACRSTTSWMKRAVERCYGVASPWRPQHIPLGSAAVNRAGHEVIVTHARKVRLIGDSGRKDNRIDAQTLAQLARIDPRLLGPVRQRSAKAQVHLTVIRARAGLVSARNGPGEYGAPVGRRRMAQGRASVDLAYSGLFTLSMRPRCKFVVSRA